MKIEPLIRLERYLTNIVFPTPVSPIIKVGIFELIFINKKQILRAIVLVKAILS
jgi:hypothetical protein